MKKTYPLSMIVCTCNGVSLGEIVHSITKSGAKDLDDITERTSAGGSCMRCLSPEDDAYSDDVMELYVCDILKKYIIEKK